MSIRLRPGIHPLAYVGVDPIIPVNMWQFPRNPRTTDWAQYQLLDHWENNLNQPTNPDYKSVWILVQKSNQKGIWVKIIGGGNGPLVSLTGNNPVAVFGDVNNNIFTVGDGVGINVVGNPATHTLTWSLVGGGQAIQGLQPAVNGVAQGVPVTPIAGIINVNNTDINIVPSDGVPNPNNLNLNLSPIVHITHGVAVGLTAPGNILQPSVIDDGFVNVYSSGIGGGIIQILNSEATTASGIIRILKGRGGTVTPTPALVGDSAGTFATYAYGNNPALAIPTMAITSQVKVDSGASTISGDMQFFTSNPVGTLAQVGIFTNTGRLQVGTTLYTAETVAVEVVTGDITIDAGNLNMPTTTQFGTKGVIFFNTNPTIHQYSNGGSGNIYVGANAGNLVNTNVSSQNSGFGVNTLTLVTTGSDNLALGTGALRDLTTSQSNTAVGWGALNKVTTGAGLNVALGNGAGITLLTGTFNTLLGSSAGVNYVGAESSNIIINAGGVPGESNVIRIGTQGGGAGDQNVAYMAGITGATTGANAVPVYVDSTGLLGTSGGSTYTDWTAFTPTIDGATPGVTTYSSQLGMYIRTGNIVTCQISIAITAATGTGNIVLGNLPFTISNTIAINPRGTLTLSSTVITWPVGTTMIALAGQAATKTAFIQAVGSGVAISPVQMANGVAIFQGELTYRI